VSRCDSSPTHPIGVLEAVGNVALFLALLGSLSIASVLLSLYPVTTTILLATALLDERMSRIQLAGVGLALMSVILIAMS
jgi:drug/metabolite transporter (DMT)-like permease